MIQLYHVTKRYPPGINALTDVSLQIEKGDFVFLTGPSGAGKTTLLKLLFREELPTEGQIVVRGRNLAVLPAGAVPYLRRSMGVVFQDFKLIHRKTVYENTALALHVVGVPESEHKARVLKVLRMVGLQHRMHSYPLQISGGEQQRVAIARALINEPVLLLADEPTGNLDPELSMEIMRLFREINAQGATILVATHDPALIRAFGRRVIHLEGGRLIDSAQAQAPGERLGLASLHAVRGRT
ncbi:MAG TPA: cell division ATP-binding protein FtsE [Candidatus Saccharimonadales bacterium]|nr:cell division ATP-binding protein FtsE [Candidatus Saccharimonadales bacterium]